MAILWCWYSTPCPADLTRPGGTTSVNLHSDDQTIKHLLAKKHCGFHIIPQVSRWKNNHKAAVLVDIFRDKCDHSCQLAINHTILNLVKVLNIPGYNTSLHGQVNWSFWCRTPRISNHISSHTQWSVGWNWLSIPKLQRSYRWSLAIDK